ncbi:MAG: glycosyltransferase family 4 protein [Anaerococcus sp.]|nr:glycosyltransferase family 4 protein [Anaerococcus sp.]
MKILIYSKDYDLVKESGVGKAIDHQKRALDKNNFPYLTDDTKDFDLVHINTVFPKSVSFARKAKKRGKKVIFHGHSTMEDFKNSFIFSNLLAPIFKRWLIYCYRQSDLILTPSNYSKKILETYGLNRPIEVVSNGIDLDFWQKKEGDRDKFYEKYGLDKNRKSIISVGLPIKRKGIDDFLRLAERLKEYYFIWFGKLDRKLMSPHIAKMIEEAPSNVIFPGYVLSKDLRLAYSGSDLYLFLTHEETEGIVLLEALALKADILIRDIEIFEKDFKDGVNIYKGSNLDEFEEKIQKILKKDLKSLGQVAYKKAQDKSIEKIGKELINIYRKVVNNEIGS